MTTLLNQIPNLPKSELHVHLRGAMPIGFFTRLLNQRPIQEILSPLPASTRTLFEKTGNIQPFLEPRVWDENEVKRLFSYTDFDEFLATFFFTGLFLKNSADFRGLVHAVLESLRAQNIVYAEITVSVMEYMRNGISLEEIGQCLAETRVEGLEVQWIVDLVRNFGKEKVLTLLQDVIALKCPKIVGITLGGSEHLFPPEQFEDTYALARKQGLRLTIHAGESLGPKSIWDSLQILKAERIGHGIHAVKDKALVRYLAENQIPLEVCPTSNFKTGVLAPNEVHPLFELWRAGVPITLNTDDPTFFGSELTSEYLYAATGIPEAGLREILQNGFRYAFLSEEKKAKYIQDLVETKNYSKF